jgi:hypothetical protein
MTITMSRKPSYFTQLPPIPSGSAFTADELERVWDHINVVFHGLTEEDLRGVVDVIYMEASLRNSDDLELLNAFHVLDLMLLVKAIRGWETEPGPTALLRFTPKHRAELMGDPMATVAFFKLCGCDVPVHAKKERAYKAYCAFMRETKGVCLDGRA